jgi:hypothetical protein
VFPFQCCVITQSFAKGDLDPDGRLDERSRVASGPDGAYERVVPRVVATTALERNAG